jgi:hypothetical protein
MSGLDLYRLLSLLSRGDHLSGGVGCQNVAMVLDQRFQAAASYSLMRPPRIGRRRILP